MRCRAVRAAWASADAEFERHIAYDIGAAAATRAMAPLLRAPALLTTYSRLLIDPNRGADDPTLVMRVSDGAIVPGNARIGTDEVGHRIDRFWRPYRDEDRRDPRCDAGHRRRPCRGVDAFLHAVDEGPRAALARRPAVGRRPPARCAAAHAPSRREPDLQPAAQLIGDNEPYDGALPGDTMDTHATRRGLANVLVEVRQDLIGDDANAAAWGVRLARLLAPILERPDLHEVRQHPSRAGRKARRLTETGIRAGAPTRRPAPPHCRADAAHRR